MSYQPKNPNGQATMANSEPVVIASDQSAIPITATNLDVQSGGADLATSTQAAAIQTSVELIDNAIAGSEMQVDVVAALPAGNNNIGDVDVATLPGVQFQDVFVTGQGSQTALNQNVVLASAGTGSYDTLNGTTGISFRTVSLHIVPASGTVTAGVITFEGSNDNFVSTAAPLFLSDAVNVTAIPVSTVTLAASTPRYFTGAIPFRYFRARISTGITGTTTGVQCFSVFSPIPFSSPRLTVSQATAASLNTTVTGTVAATMAANATTTPAKARDVASGANDTGIPAWYVRRDTPTTVTPVAGDWEPAQIDSMGVQWVREKSSTVSAVTSVAASATTVTVLALNAQRRGATIHNDSTAILYLKLGATASTTSFTVKMQPDSYYEVPAQYTGVIDGIWASATGSARVTEISS